MKFQKASSISGRLTVPGDKSISHRAVMFGSISEGITEINHFLQGKDCLSTIRCFQQLGISIENIQKDSRVIVHGKGLHGLQAPQSPLDVGNSGTTLRLISGILSGQHFTSELTGDDSIKKRPMNRIITPLTQMGAAIASIENTGCAPLQIRESKIIHGITYPSPVASAQIKSSLLLAGLYADSKTTVIEPHLSRNHTELMLSALGASLAVDQNAVSIQPFPRLHGIKIDVPGDISSAAYFIACALLLPNSEIVIERVGINPTRDGILTVCKAMGADITTENITNTDSEAVCDLRVRSSRLSGTTISGSLIPRLIDELPILAVLACFAEGETIIADAAELKVKESNRLQVIEDSLCAMGADITPTQDGMVIRGGKTLHGAKINSHMDHRIAMSFAIAALAAEEETEILDAECVTISYPEFYQDLKRLVR